MQAFASAIPLAAQTVQTPVTSPGKQPGEQSMELGAFSISLAVKNLNASRQFYEKFGFTAFAGDASRGVLILKNGDHVIGRFQGMFDNNILTFNPGWDSNGKKLTAFTDVRELQRRLKAHGVKLAKEADESTTGPASFVAFDPDGNQILVDQHL
jgi:catechol 2,3-dioxygenase-like lactoylglutathione lyase family enzyme